MKLIKEIFDKYLKGMKVITTFIGTVFIYFIAILLGKFIYMFTKNENHNFWRPYQSGFVSDKMF